MSTPAPEHAAPENSQQPNEPEQETATSAAPKKKSPPALAIALALSGVLLLMLMAFATPSLKSGAHKLPLAISGPQQTTSAIEKQLDAKKPGAFDFHTYASESDAARAIRDRKTVGGIAVTQKGMEIQTATAAGSPYAPMLKGIGAGIAESGKKVSYTELAPYPKGDVNGSAMTVLPLPLTFGGMITAVVLSLVYKGKYRHKLAAVVTLAAIVGFAGMAILHYGFSAFQGNYLQEVAALGMGIAAISLMALGLVRVMKMPGLGVMAVLLIFCSNPLSGLATGPQWLPHPWGTIGQLLPIGATGTAIRSAAYFDGHGATMAWTVLGVWILGGLALMGVGKRREHPAPRHAQHAH